MKLRCPSTPASTIVALAALFLCFVSAPAPARADSQSLQIAAAANLTNVFNDKIIPEFLKETGITVLPTYGATGLLAKQLEAGAPYEVFVSADASTPAKLAGEHDLDPTTVKPYTVGQLALWSKGLMVDVQGLSVLPTVIVTAVAVANPQTAPYGAASMETLTNAKMMSAVQPKIVYAENISEAFQYAQSGNADVAFTALALTIGRGGHTYIVPAKYHTPLVQSVGLIPNAGPAAVKFEQFLLSKNCQKIFASYGYLKPPAQ
jgi:molybdate transport system substrate-binding protein